MSHDHNCCNHDHGSHCSHEHHHHHQTKRVLDRPALVQAAILLMWVVAIAWLFISGNAAMLINPRYFFLPITGGVLLLAMLVWRLANCTAEIPIDETGLPADCYDGSRHEILDPLQRLAVLLIPPLFLMTFGLKFLDPSGVVGGRYDDLVEGLRSQITADETATERASALPEAGLLDLLYGSDEWDGKEIKAVGMAVRYKQREDHFALVRLQIACCAVHGTPVFVPVKGEFPPGIEPGSWVSVHGVFRATGGPEGQGFVELTEAFPAPAPRNPYVY